MVEKAAPARARRADILRAAQREFARGGYAGARIERIAASAGVNKQLLFHYFGSKEGLFAAALAPMLARGAAGPRPDSPVDQIRRLLGELYAAASSTPGMVGILADARANPEFPREARTAVQRWREEKLANLSAAISEGQRRGHFRDDVEPDLVAAIGLGAALGAALLGGAAPASLDTAVSRLLLDYCAWR
jgi:TetR/AcrR family transcriptional regulator